MGLYLLDYGAGNVQSLANSIEKLGHKFTWITQPADFTKATVSQFPDHPRNPPDVIYSSLGASLPRCRSF